jgi:flagellar hook-associated protein 2
MAIGLPGVFSGIDTDLLIAYDMQAASGPLTRLESQRSSWEAKLSAAGDVETQLRSLRTLVAGMRDSDDLRAVLASTSDTDILGASATGSATEGVHEVIVNRLASAEKEIHDGVTPTETWGHTKTVVGAGSEYLSAAEITTTEYEFIFQFGDETQITVDLSAYIGVGISLSNLVTEINTASQAASTYDAAEAEALGDDNYRLKIEAKVAGDGKSLTVTDGTNSIDALNDTTVDFEQIMDGEVGSDYIVGAGDFVYTYNGVTRTKTTSSSTTLGQLRDMINNDAENPGVTATILDYEGAAAQRYHLVLSGDYTGDDYAIAVDVATTLSGFDSAAWTETQTAQDSQIRVDGYPAGQWIERSSNTVTDVIAGVTLNLYDTGTVTVNLTRDTTQLKSDLGSLVSIYNNIASEINEHAGYDADTDTAGVLIGDPAMRGILSQIRAILTGSAEGFESGEDPFTLPAEIGIEIDRDGLLTLHTDSYTDDEVTYLGLNDALAEDYYGTLYLIGAAGRGGSDSEYALFNSALDSTTAGTYELKVKFNASDEVTEAHFRTKGEGEGDWRVATVEGSNITGQIGNPERGLSVTVSVDPAEAGGEHWQTAEIRVQQGFAGELYDLVDGLLNQVDGAFTIKQERYQDAIDRIDRQIDIKQGMLEQKEERLKARYARLEAVLARLDSMQGAFDALYMAVQSINSARSYGSSS